MMQSNPTMEHEVILKRILIKLCLEKELEEVMRGKYNEDLIMVNYLINKIFLEFPPLIKYKKEHPDKYANMDFLV